MAGEFKELLEWSALVVSLGTVAFHYGVGHQRIKAVEQRQDEQAKRFDEQARRFDEFMAACKGCKADLDAEDSEVHGRVTGVSERVARLEGQMKGGHHG